MSVDSSNSIPTQEENAVTYALRTDLLEIIHQNISLLYVEYPEESLASIVYTAVLAVLRNPKIRRTDGSMVPDILVYYLESYRKFKETQYPEVDSTGFVNEAGLELFDLYVKDPHNQTKRSLVEATAETIQEHWIDRIVSDSNIEGIDEFTASNNLTMMTHSLPYYTTRPRRTKNVRYVAWLKSTLSRLFETGDARFLLNDSQVQNVLKQILNKKKIIVIPTH